MSPPNEERRPRQERRPEDSAATTPLELFSGDDTAARPQIAEEWDRKRAAERRITAIPRRRDPEGLTRDRWTSPRVLHIEEGSRHTAWLWGGRLKGLCEHANVPHLWDAETRTWKVSRKRLGALISYARQVEGRFVTTELVDR